MGALAKRRFIVALVFMLVLTGQASASAQDDPVNEFTVIAVKNYTYLPVLNSFSDADEFNRCFGAAVPGGLGWSRIQYAKDAEADYWDFYDYANGLAADDGDILYFMGHGYWAEKWGKVTIYSPLALRVFKDRHYSPTDGNSYVNPERIGTYSSSRWDGDLEWAILGTCNTLRDNGSASRWGQTLYNGMHTICGYKDTSSGHPDDFDIIRDWENRVRGIGYPIQCVTEAWLGANLDNPVATSRNPNWAAVGHSADFYDHIWGFGTVGDDVRGRIDDVRYYDSVTYPNGGKIPVAVASKALSGRGARTTLRVALPASPERARVLTGRAATAGRVFVAPQALGTRAVPTNMSRGEATKLALDYVRRTWGLPPDARVVDVCAVRSRPLFDADSRPVTAGPPTVLRYTVRFGHSADGVPILGDEEISVDVQGSGVVRASKSWHQKFERSHTARSIGPDRALSIFAASIDGLLDVAGRPLDVEEVTLGYLPTVSTDATASATLRPVWHIGFRVSGSGPDVNRIYLDVDAISGAIMCSVLG